MMTHCNTLGQQSLNLLLIFAKDCCKPFILIFVAFPKKPYLIMKFSTEEGFGDFWPLQEYFKIKTGTIWLCLVIKNLVKGCYNLTIMYHY